MLDVVIEYFKVGCPYDWNEMHLDDEDCPRCQRDQRRRARIARYHNAKLLPPARAL
jgi:hypothetical protein